MSLGKKAKSIKFRRRFWSIMAALAGAGILAVTVISLTVPRNLFADSYSTIVYSADGQLLGARIAPDGQ